MPTRYQMNVPQHPDDNYSINKAFDRNYGNRLKSGDTTPLKYTIKDGDGEPLDKDRLMGMETTVKMKHEGVTAYEAEFEATLEEVSEGYEGDLVARYKIMEALPPSDTPYIVEFHFEEADDRFIFPSGNNLPLYITPSSLNSDGEAIKNASEQRLNEIVERKLEENPVLSEAEAKELARQENYQELLDTGVMQTKINERLEDLEEEYAPKLTEVTAQLAQTGSELSKKLDKNRGAVKSVDLSQEVREQLTGGSVAVVGRNSISEENIIEGTSLEKFEGMNKTSTSPNLADPKDFVAGVYYNYEDGREVKSEGRGTTGFIPVKIDKAYSSRTNSENRVTFWDNNFSFISGLQGDRLEELPGLRHFKIPNNPEIKYARHAFNIRDSKLEDISVWEGMNQGDASPYSYDYRLSPRILPYNRLITGNYSEEKSKVNAFDKDKIRRGGYYDALSGEWIETLAFASSDYIEVNPTETWYKHHRSGHINYYNRNKERLYGEQISSRNWVTIPNDNRISYLKLSARLEFLDEIMFLNTAEIPEEYIPYDKDKGLLLSSIIKVRDENLESTKLVSDVEELKNTKLDKKLSESLFHYSYQDVYVEEGFSPKYDTSYWFLKITKNTFEGKTIVPQVELTSSGIDKTDNDSVMSFAKINDDLLTINAGIFNMSTKISDGFLISNGKILQDKKSTTHKNQYTLGIRENGHMEAFPESATAEELLDKGIVNAVVGFVPLIENGRSVENSVIDLVVHAHQANPRQIIGLLENDDYFVLTVDGRDENSRGLKLEEAIDFLLERNVKFAYNLDGGGSTQTFIKQKRVNRLLGNRRIPNVIVFKEKE